MADEVAVTTSSDASGTSGRGNSMLERGAESITNLRFDLGLPGRHYDKK